MRFAPLDRVETQGGRRGVVKSIEGRHVTVMFNEGDEFIDVDDLQIVPQTADEALLAGQVGDAELFGLRLRALVPPPRLPIRRPVRPLERSRRAQTAPGLRGTPGHEQAATSNAARGRGRSRQDHRGRSHPQGAASPGRRRAGPHRLSGKPAAPMAERAVVEVQRALRDHESPAAKYLSQGKVNPFTRRDNVITSLNFAADREAAGADPRRRRGISSSSTKLTGCDGRSKAARR